MDVDLKNFRIMGLIAHEVPVRGDDGVTGPTLSEVESPIQAEWRNYFRERLTESLAKSVTVGFDEDTTSPVPDLLTNYFKTQTKFVALSQSLATRLYEAQSRRNNAGLLIVIRGQIDEAKTPRKALAVLKLEKESGIRAKQSSLLGKKTFVIEHLRDLMLTQNTKVFKAGLFHETEDDPICSHVSDNQLGFQASNEIALFFLKYLGCKSKQEAQIVTKHFFHAAEAFINTAVQDPKLQARYHNALLSELQSQKRLITPIGFAQEHLLTEDRSKFLSSLSEQDVSPTAFLKDLSLVKGQIGETELILKSGISISGPPEVFEKAVRMQDGRDGNTRIEIEGQVAKMKGRKRSRPKSQDAP